MPLKRTHFALLPGKGWPNPKDLEPYFLAPPGKEWFFHLKNDNAGLSLEGVDGTEHLPAGKGRIDINLEMWGNRDHGVMLIWSRRGDGQFLDFASKGDMRRLNEHVRTMHGDRMPVGLYIPFATAWKAVKEFIETEGRLPGSMAWVANEDLPPGTFPEP